MKTPEATGLTRQKQNLPGPWEAKKKRMQLKILMKVIVLTVKTAHDSEAQKKPTRKPSECDAGCITREGDGQHLMIS